MNLTADRIDAIQELINIGVGRAVSVLNDTIDAHIGLLITQIEIEPVWKLRQELELRLGNKRVAAVRQDFYGPFTGRAELVFSTDNASNLAAKLMGEKLGIPDLDAVRISTLSEVGNILISCAIGSIGNLIKQNFFYELPAYLEDTVENLLKYQENDAEKTMLLARMQFEIEHYHLHDDIISIFEVNSCDFLISAIAQ